MARVRCITMQKGEGMLLDAWLRYYGYLFGFENLEVIDNGSQDGLTRRILEQFETVGVTVQRHYPGLEHFEAKGSIVAGIINGWDDSYDYDFALPCDIDEFIALFTRDGMSCRRDRIHAVFDSLIGTRQALWMETSLFNVPAQPGWFHPEIFAKGFLPSGSIMSLDSGFHVPVSRHAEGRLRTELTYLHYHNKPYELVQAHTRRKLASRLDIDDREALRTYSGPGAHMTKDLLMSQDDYLRQFDRSITLQFEQFPNLIRALGARDPMLVGAGRALPAPTLGKQLEMLPESITLRLPAREPPGPGAAGSEFVTFDGRGYLEDHADVAASATSGLPHYLYYGFQEYRTLRRQQPSPPLRARSRNRIEAA